MPKLFAVYVGGAVAGGNIEVHDMRFVVADRIEETYDQLRRDWWGKPESLHLDGWAVLDHVDGFDISIAPQRRDNAERLYFAYLGGTQPGEFMELHKNLFLVARSPTDAKAKAMQAVAGWNDAHRDNLYDLDDLICIDDSLFQPGRQLALTPAVHARPLQFTCRYVKIGAATKVKHD